MVNTLRITSVLAAGLAIALISFSVVYGFRSDTNVDALLESPTVLEQLEENKDTRPQQTNTKESRLVVQAKKFALHLNPPARPVQRPTGGKAGAITVRPTTPPPPPAKFQVVGISHSTDPNLSRAMISEAGTAPRWVCLEDSIGHHTVIAINETGITLSNNQEVAMEQRPHISLVMAEGEVRPERTRSVADSVAEVQRSRASQARYAAPQPGVPRPIRSRSIGSTVRTTPPRRPPLSDKDTAAMQKLIQKLHSFNKNGEALSPEDERARQEIVDKLKAVHSQRLSQREAETLDHLGNRLDPNVALKND